MEMGITLEVEMETEIGEGREMEGERVKGWDGGREERRDGREQQSKLSERDPRLPECTLTILKDSPSRSSLHH